MPVPDGVDPAEAVCIPLAYLTAFQMLSRYRRLSRREILVIGAQVRSVQRCSISLVIRLQGDWHLFGREYDDVERSAQRRSTIALATP